MSTVLLFYLSSVSQSVVWDGHGVPVLEVITGLGLCSLNLSPIQASRQNRWCCIEALNWALAHLPEDPNPSGPALSSPEPSEVMGSDISTDNRTKRRKLIEGAALCKEVISKPLSHFLGTMGWYGRWRLSWLPESWLRLRAPPAAAVATHVRVAGSHWGEHPDFWIGKAGLTCELRITFAGPTVSTQVGSLNSHALMDTSAKRVFQVTLIPPPPKKKELMSQINGD